MTIKLSTLVRDRDTDFTTLNFLQANNNLSDVGSAVDSLNNLGITASPQELNLLDGVNITLNELNTLGGLTANTAELNYTDGVTSNLQTQLDAKVDETSATGSAVIPSGNTALRDGSPNAGYLRFNSETVSFEGYDGTSWGDIGGGGGGTGTGLASQTANTSSTTQTSIATYDATTIGSIKAFVQAKDGNDRYISELLITHDGNTAVATEYGQVATNISLATYDVDIANSEIRILATAASTNATDYIVQSIEFTE